MTRTIGISIFKGGTGKTTIAVNLAAALAVAGRRVLLVDCDTQGQCAQALGVEPEAGLAELVAGDTGAVTAARPGLDLVAGGRAVSGLKVELSQQLMGATLAIEKALRPLLPRYHYCLLDVSPGYDALSIAALFAVGEVLAPVRLEPLAVNGLVDLVERLAEINAVRGDMGRPPALLRYIVPNAVDRRVAQTGELTGQLLAAFADKLTEPVRLNVRLSEAAGHGETILEYAPDSPGAADVATLAERLIHDEA